MAGLVVGESPSWHDGRLWCRVVGWLGGWPGGRYGRRLCGWFGPAGDVLRRSESGHGGRWCSDWMGALEPLPAGHGDGAEEAVRGFAWCKTRRRPNQSPAALVRLLCILEHVVVRQLNVGPRLHPREDLAQRPGTMRWIHPLPPTVLRDPDRNIHPAREQSIMQTFNAAGIQTPIVAGVWVHAHGVHWQIRAELADEVPAAERPHPHLEPWIN